MNYNDIHIGSRIQQVMKDQGRNVSWFAKQICFERSNVYKMFKRKSIDTDLLIKISEVLGHDFLSEYFYDKGSRNESKTIGIQSYITA